MMKPVLVCALVIACIGGSVEAQVEIHSPADLTTTDTCAAVPFACLPPIPGGPGYTWVQSVPAALLDPAHPVVRDVAFASCTGNGIFQTWDCVFAIGHVPDPMPDPFVFPDPIAGTLGSFLDLTVFWNSNEDGFFLWTGLSATWSPFGLSPRGGTGFTWNGTDDVAVFLTHQLSLTAPQFAFSGVMHGAPHDRARASVGYLQPTSQNMGPTMTDIKMRLTCDAIGWDFPRYDLGVAVGAAGDLTLTVSNLPAGTVEGWVLISDYASTLSTGLAAPFGLSPSPLTFGILTNFPTATAGHPLHWLATSPGAFPNVPFSFPAGSTTGLAGITWDWMSLTVDAGGIAALSNVVRRTF